MILRNQLIQRHRKQRPLTPTFSLNESHEKCPRSREGIFSFVYRPAQCFVTVCRRPPVNREGGGKVRRVHYPRSPGRAVRWIKNNTSAGMAKSRSSTIASAVLMA